MKITNETFLTAYGWGDPQRDGPSVADYGCLSVWLYSGQSCTNTIASMRSAVGTGNEPYILATGIDTLYGDFTATGRRRMMIPPVVALPGRSHPS